MARTGSGGSGSGASVTVKPDAPAYLVKGDDPSLVAQTARQLIAKLVGDRDPALVVEEHGTPGGRGGGRGGGAGAGGGGGAGEGAPGGGSGSSGGGAGGGARGGGTGEGTGTGTGTDTTTDLNVGAVVDACMTPPFLIDRRVVVVRDAGRLTAHDATRLAEVLAHPLESTHLVLVAGGGAIPASLSKAVTNAGGDVVDCTVRTAGDRKGWVADRLHAAPVRLDAGAANLLRTHLGEDLSRVDGVLSSLAAAYGEGAAVDEARLEPFLGQAGAVPPWELTGAIDDGDVAHSLGTLARLTDAGGLAGPAIVGILHRHFANMLRLAGDDVRNEDEAAAVLGMRAGYPVKRALAQSRRLGSERLAEAITLLAEADVNVKGRTGLPTALVLEVLVARLARLSRAGGRGAGGRASGGRASGGRAPSRSPSSPRATTARRG